MAAASNVACLGRNTCDLLSVVASRRWNRPRLRAGQDQPKKWIRVRSRRLAPGRGAQLGERPHEPEAREEHVERLGTKREPRVDLDREQRGCDRQAHDEAHRDTLPPKTARISSSHRARQNLRSCGRRGASLSDAIAPTMCCRGKHRTSRTGRPAEPFVGSAGPGGRSSPSVRARNREASCPDLASGPGRGRSRVDAELALEGRPPGR